MDTKPASLIEAISSGTFSVELVLFVTILSILKPVSGHSIGYWDSKLSEISKEFGKVSTVTVVLPTNLGTVLLQFLSFNFTSPETRVAPPLAVALTLNEIS